MGTVVVHAIEVVAAVDEGDVFGGPLGKSIAELLHHAVGVFPVVYRVCEPGDVEFDLPFAGFDVCWVFRVPRLGPITCYLTPSI